MSGATRVVVEYDDATSREIAFSELGFQAQRELAKLGLCEQPTRPTTTYLLLEWKDGWKEVVAVDERTIELLRYYTVERVEEIGRLSLEVAGSTPELMLVKRLPALVENILLVAPDQVEQYALQEKATVKEGGKREHVFYDKKRPGFCKEKVESASACYQQFLDSVKGELQNRGISAGSVLTRNEAERFACYREMSSALGLRGTERQQDVYGFLQVALEKLEEPEMQARSATNN